MQRFHSFTPRRPVAVLPGHLQPLALVSKRGWFASFAFACALLAAGLESHAARTCVSAIRAAGTSECIDVAGVNTWIQQEQLRISKSGVPTEAIEVEFRAGEFLLEVPIRLLRPPTGFLGRVVISGQGAATILRGVTKLSIAERSVARSPIAGLPKETRLFRLPQDIAQQIPANAAIKFGKPNVPALDVLVQGKRIPNTKRALSDFGGMEPVDGQTATRFRAALAANRYARETDLVATGYFNHEWAEEQLPIMSLDSTAGIFTLNEAPTYGIRKNARVFIANALADLAPGTWAYNRATSTLYVVPSDGQNLDAVEIPLVPSAILAEDITNISIRDLTIDGFRKEGIRLSGVADLTMERVEVSNTGSTGISITGSRAELKAMNVHDTGGAGISLNGGNRQTLTPGNLHVSASSIRNIGVFRRTYAPAIGLLGVGNSITNSVLLDGPHVAILFKGNDHLIAGNRIERFVQETDDAGAIYTGGRDWTERGTVIENNILADIGGSASRVYKAKGVYLDDQTSGVTVRSNLFLRVAQPTYINGGRDNTIEDNLMVQCEWAVTISNHGMGNLTKPTGRLRHADMLAKLAAFKVNQPPYSLRYPSLAMTADQGPTEPRGNRVGRNTTTTACASLALRGLTVSDVSLGTGRTLSDAPDLSGVRPQTLTEFIRAQYGRARAKESVTSW